MKTISLIIPTYNMEAYLPQCLDSIMPVAAEGDLEIIIVNDGSKDGSLAIAENYRQRNPEAIKVIDKENGGYGSGVNAGLKVATGRYVKLLDADDWMDTDILRKIVATLRDMEDVDVVFTSYNRQYEGGPVVFRRQRLPAGQILDADKNWHNKSALGLGHHGVMYRRDMLTECHYEQLEHCLYTDIQWSFSPFQCARKFYAFDEPLYQYRLGREGQSVDISVKKKKFADYIRVTEAMLHDYETSTPPPIRNAQMPGSQARKPASVRV